MGTHLVNGKRDTDKSRDELIDELNILRGLSARGQGSAKSSMAGRECEGCYRTLFDNANDAIFVLDLSGHFADVNQAAIDRLGYSRAEYLAMTISDIYAPDYAMHVPERMSEIMKNGSAVFESCLMRRDGSVMPVEVSARLFKCDGQPMVLSIVRDITKRKRAEEALRKSEARLAKSQKIAHLGSYDWDIAHNTDEWSDELFNILGIRPGEVRPSLEAFMRFVYPDDRKIVNKHLDDMFKKYAYPGGYEIRIVRPDGSIRWARLDGESTCDRSGMVTRLFGTIMDITEHKRAEEELASSKRQAELYLDLMGHDITNMNQVLLGYMEMMNAMRETGAIDNALIDDSIDVIHRSTRMIGNVKKLTQLQAGRVPLKAVDVCKILSKVKARYSCVSNKPVSINYTPAESCIVRAGDSLEDVFDNLVDNAIRHSKGPVTIDMGVDKVVADGHLYYRISVADMGPGIPDDLKRKIFMTSAELAGKTQRRGFGLYMVRTLVDYYGGKVRVEDRVEGDHTKGARFVVVLPAVEK
jgi:PAS domain S-box-containing protein